MLINLSSMKIENPRYTAPEEAELQKVFSEIWLDSNDFSEISDLTSDIEKLKDTLNKQFFLLMNNDSNENKALLITRNIWDLTITPAILYILSKYVNSTLVVHFIADSVLYGRLENPEIDNSGESNTKKLKIYNVYWMKVIN